MSASCHRQAPNPRQNKSDLIESLLSETALNTREINPADPVAGHAIAADWLEGIAFKASLERLALSSDD